MIQRWIIGAILVTQLNISNQAPTIQGVNSAVIGISQDITMDQLIANFLVFSDDYDTLTLQDVSILDGSTCDLSSPTIGSCVILFQIADHGGRLSTVFPFELTWIDDTKPIMESPTTIWLNPNYPIDYEWVESLCSYDRTSLTWDVISVDSESTYLVTAVSDEFNNRYYHRISILVDDEFPIALGWQMGNQYGLSIHSQYTLSQVELDYVSQLWQLSIDVNQTAWQSYLSAPNIDSVFELNGVENEIIRLQVQSQFGNATSTTFWDTAWQFLNSIYDWIVMQCHSIWQRIVDFLQSIPLYRIL